MMILPFCHYLSPVIFFEEFSNNHITKTQTTNEKTKLPLRIKININKKRVSKFFRINTNSQFLTIIML